MNRRILLSFMALLLAYGSPSLAGTIQLPKTGQTKTYDSEIQGKYYLFLPLITREWGLYLTGNWSGQWMSDHGGGGALNANIIQSGNQISGTISATGTIFGNATGNLSGTISNPNGSGYITMVAWNNEGSVNFGREYPGGIRTGTYNNTRISATYQASNGDSGTIVLYR